MRFIEKCKKVDRDIQDVFGRITAVAEKYGIILKVILADKSSDFCRGTDGLANGSRDKFLKYIPCVSTMPTAVPSHLNMIEHPQ